MKMASFVNFNSSPKTEPNAHEKNKVSKELADRINKDQDVKNPSLQQHRTPNTYKSKSKTIETHDELERIQSELKKSLTVQAWLAKPKFLTKNKISNSKDVTETSHKLLAQLAQPKNTNKLRYGLSEVGDLVNKHVGQRGYEQRLRHYWGYAQVTDSGSAPSLNIEQFNNDYTHVKQRFEFSLTTQSGKKIKFSLRYGANHKSDVDKVLPFAGEINFSEIAISFQQSEALNEKEQRELAQLTGNMELFFADFFEKDQANFGLLRLTEFTEIQDLSLYAENPMAPSELTRIYGLSFEYHSGQAGDHIKTSFKNNQAEMRVSKAELFNKNPDNRQQALEHYLSVLDQSKEKSKASQMQIDMMKSVFKLALQPTKKEIELLEQQTNGYKKQVGKPGSKTQEIKAKEIFIPLPDFSFDFKSNKSEKREHEEFGVSSEFDLKLSLESTQTQEGSRTIREQKQHFELEGSYTKPSGSGDLKVDHKYRASKIVRAETEAGLLMSATIREDNFADVRKRFYGINPKTGKPELLREEHKITRHQSVKDITEWFVKADDKNSKKLLEEVLIEPFKEGELVYYRRYHYLDKYYAKRSYHFPGATNANT